MPDDLKKSVEQCTKHNGSQERIRKGFLKRHQKRIDEEYANEIQELSKNNKMKPRQAVREDELLVSQPEYVSSE
jgi:hypothetical protein